MGDPHTPIRVRIYSPLAERTGLKSGSGSLSLNYPLLQSSETLPSYLSRLGEAYGPRLQQALFDEETGKIRPSIVLLLNNQLINHSEIEGQVLSPGDEIIFLPAFSGG
jgi:molybdopterin converting factor small subunit